VAVGPVAVVTGVTGSAQDLWAQFCASGEISSTATAKDVAGSVAQQLKHVSCLRQCALFLMTSNLTMVDVRRPPSQNRLRPGP
jgi:hypothetical protein